MNDIELKMCPLCYAVEDVKIAGALTTECPFCGKFSSDVATRDLMINCPEEFDDNWRLKTRYVVKKNNLRKLKPNNTVPLEDLSEARLKEINENYSVPGLLDKTSLVLEYLVQNTSFFGEKIIVDVNTLFPLFYCKNNTELYNILNYLSESNLCSILDTELPCTSQSSKYPKRHYMYNYVIEDAFYSEYCTYTLFPLLQVSLTSKGIEQFNKAVSSSTLKQAFVAMWFNRVENINECKYDMQKVYEQAIEPAISTSKDKYSVMRIDCKEHCNDINDEMIAEIRKSKFLVADLTGYRGGVYFEAGFAYGLSKPVIYTCNKNWLVAIKNENGKITREGVHFDLNHRNIILWDYDKLDDFKEALKRRIEAVII